VNWSAVCRAGNQRRGRALLPNARSRHRDSQLGNDAADALALREIESGLCARSATYPDREARTLVAIGASTGDALKPAQRDLLVPPPLSAQSAGPTLSACGQRSSHRWRHRIGVGRAREQCDRRVIKVEPGPPDGGSHDRGSNVCVVHSVHGGIGHESGLRKAGCAEPGAPSGQSRPTISAASPRLESSPLPERQQKTASGSRLNRAGRRAGVRVDQLWDRGRRLGPCGWLGAQPTIASAQAFASRKARSLLFGDGM
jgi:hypothetical protein